MSFHPLVQTWFESRFGDATEPQQQGWPLIQSGHPVLIAAPTGSGKTLAAFLCAIDQLVRLAVEQRLEPQTRVLYVSPLKALANDIRRNLLEPLSEIRNLAAEQGLELPEIRALVRSGDTSPHHRRKMLDKPPHILVTTPESFFILLTSRRGNEMLSSVRTVILDEIHSVAQSKRGSHLLLSLERLDHLVESPVQRIGLSATQKPLSRVAQLLTGSGTPPAIVDVGHRRRMEIAVDVPSSELGAVASHDVWQEIYEKIAALSQSHRTTLVFVNTRRLSERVAHHLTELLGEEKVAAHHGSLSKETRLKVEQRLKQGDLKVVIATASLELGIDVGSVDLVCQINSTRSIGLALQRIGRSGHWRGAIPKGLFFPTTRDDLLECAALVDCIRKGELDRLRIPAMPLDVLAQQIVAAAAVEDWDEPALLALLRRAAPYRKLSDEVFDALLSMLSEGITTRRGRWGAYLHRDRVNGRIRARRNARLAALTSGGAIPDNANFLVKADPEDIVVGDLDEDFAVESSQGDIFLLGNTSWRIRRVEAGVVRVEDAQGAPPNVPFWRGEAPGRTDELSAAVSRLREDIYQREPAAAQEWLIESCGLNQAGAEQAVRYVRAGAEALGGLPTQSRIIAERFFDEGGGMQLVLHAPFGSRINKAWGLALRKRFCRSFNFELQAAATEDGIVLSLSDQHSFPLDSVFGFLRSANARELLVQALLAVPQFGVRWRWTATRALAILRFAGGKKVAPQLQRMRAEDLLASIFPEQAACLEHIVGDIEIPDHPLVNETLADCLLDAMDVDGFQRMVETMEQGGVECMSVDTREPSPFCHEILNANPYAFLDPAPLEERRTRAVQTRRTLLPEGEGDLARLDSQAIERVLEEAWPVTRDPDELHDMLLTLGVATDAEARSRPEDLKQLMADSRAFELDVEPPLWVAAERIGLIRKAYPEVLLKPAPDSQVEAAQWERDKAWDSEQSTTEIVRYRLEICGPVTVKELAGLLVLPEKKVEAAALRLEAEGQILRGSFRPGTESLEWCDRRLLARIHRLTLGRLRREIEPVSAADFMRFLFRWQHVSEGSRLHDKAGLALVLKQLQGFDAPAVAWEKSILPLRIADYSPELLDQLCLSGQFAWGRLATGNHLESPRRTRALRPTRVAPIAFFERSRLETMLLLARGDQKGLEENLESAPLTHAAAEIARLLERYGACFYQELLPSVGRLPMEVESGLWELVASGLVTADGFATLRALIDRKQRLSGNRNFRHKRKRQNALSSGRWSLLAPRRLMDSQSEEPGDGGARTREAIDKMAWILLRRWGVIFRDLARRESVAPPWRDLVQVYRRAELQGKIRGGRFVAGLSGEQFALPEAVDALRNVRRQQGAEELVTISAADPLNLIGIVVPGSRPGNHPGHTLSFFNGVPQETDSTTEPLTAISR